MLSPFLKIFCSVFVFAVLLQSCKTENEEEPVPVDGKYAIESATFTTAVTYDFDGNGTTETITDALPILEETLLGLGPCGEIETYLEFGVTGKFRLTCASGTAASVEVGTWTYNAGIKTIFLNNLTVPNPTGGSGTFTIPSLAIEDVNFVKDANEIIRLNGRFQALPYGISGLTLLSAPATIVLRKIL